MNSQRNIKCPYCRKDVASTVETCPHCHMRVAQFTSSKRSRPPNHARPASPPVPGLAIIFRFLAVLEIIGGLVICSELWPGEPRPGYQWNTEAYIPALTWLMAGLISGCLFLAIAKVLIYVSQISNSLAHTVRDYNSRRESSAASPLPEEPVPPPLQRMPDDLE